MNPTQEGEPERTTSSSRVRSALALGATLALFVGVGAAAYYSRSPGVYPPDFELLQPPSRKDARRPSPLKVLPPEQPLTENGPTSGQPHSAPVQAEIVVDVDEDGNLHIGGRPSRLETLRDLLNASHLAAAQVGVTIRADERCRVLHLKEVIRACDERSGVSYKVRPLPSIVNQPPQRIRATSLRSVPT